MKQNDFWRTIGAMIFYAIFFLLETGIATIVIRWLLTMYFHTPDNLLIGLWPTIGEGQIGTLAAIPATIWNWVRKSSTTDQQRKKKNNRRKL
jgi:hypothetical protein